MGTGLKDQARPSRLVFGPFVIDAQRAELVRNGSIVAVRPKTFALLVRLTESPGIALSKQELMDAVWPGVVVTDDSLTQAISELRGALDDRDQKIIKTIPKRGYLFDVVIRPDPESSSAELANSSPALRRGLMAAGLGVLILATASSIAFVVARAPFGSDPPIAHALVASRSLAVMPFTDLSEPPAPHLAQAVDTDLAVDLGRLSDTRVVPRASAMALGTSTNLDLRRVARELDVRYVVTGGVRRQGDRLQVTAQLLRTIDGAQLWAERFDYDSAADWMERRDISARIANLLDLRMRESVLRQAGKSPANNLAIEHWMRGAFFMSRLRTNAELMQAREEFQSALMLQPDSSHALAGLAATYIEAVVYRWTSQREQDLNTAEGLARRSLEIDPQNQEAMVSLAGALMFNGRIAEAMAVTRKHLGMNPNDARANRDLAGQYFFLGQWNQSLQQVDLAIRLNPLDSLNVALCHNMAATSLLALHRYDEAIARARLTLDGPRAGGDAVIASAEAWRGNLEVAQAHAATWSKRWPGTTISRMRTHRGSKEPAYLAGMDHYFEGLRRAGVPEN
jgi:DNA-binding winged helix-turn-helix (wHTH) protein/TolB-like protein